MSAINGYSRLGKVFVLLSAALAACCFCLGVLNASGEADIGAAYFASPGPDSSVSPPVSQVKK